MKNSKDYYRGCLLGGAVGDALGYPVEMLSNEEIQNSYGEKGIRRLVLDSTSGKALISDDTQMTTFTVDGLLWADSRAKERGIYGYTPCIFYAYQKWLYTQTGYFADKNYEFLLKGEVLEWEELYTQRGPGRTSIPTLAGCINGKYGTMTNRINGSKGSGAVMRAAPVGLYFYDDSKMAFKIGCESGAITHGHPSAYLPAGVLAYVIAEIISGANLESALAGALEELQRYEGFQETLEAVTRAVSLAKSQDQTLGKSDQAAADLLDIAAIGGGWTGEEALALAVYCAMRYPNDFESAMYLAVNHDGNSDTVAAICGNILGAYLGSMEIPFKWILQVELADLMVHGADKMIRALQEEE
ncbi:ADP-ribosylglycohydrolase family protein [Bacilliculturomica massiliensis]|uniref:ADP-ribosylglycohydrolase family protein n=1 Tax=Bacilliculturomica massiliensis TaxID=1917867 RepID=UPI00102F6A9F|nr:ADP-ribosylglycohydrolase family protein [Bacilliculturomica massiliensis]